jgi:hypothetical protein
MISLPLSHSCPTVSLQHRSGRGRAVEVVSKVSVAPTSTAATAGEFNFEEYMMGRAEGVNTALDACLPMAYPESVHEVRFRMCTALTCISCWR